MEEMPDNTDRLVDLVARGEHSYAQIAEELGMSAEAVARVARGEFRQELYARIKAAERGYIQEARRLGARWVKVLLSKHIKAGMESDSETARKCREYAMSEFLKAGPANQADADPEARCAVRLTSEDLEVLAKANGGPES